MEKNWIKIGVARINLDKIYAYHSYKSFKYGNPYRIVIFCDIPGKEDNTQQISWKSSEDGNAPKEWLEATKILDEYFEVDKEKISL